MMRSYIFVVVLIILFKINSNGADYIALGQITSNNLTLASVSESAVVSLINVSIPQATDGFFGAFCQLTNTYFLIGSPNYLISFNVKTGQHAIIKMDLPDQSTTLSFCISRKTGTLYVMQGGYVPRYFATLNPDNGQINQASAIIPSYFRIAFNCIVDDDNSRIIFMGYFVGSQEQLGIYVTELSSDNQGQTNPVTSAGQIYSNIGGMFNLQKNGLFSQNVKTNVGGSIISSFSLNGTNYYKWYGDSGTVNENDPQGTVNLETNTLVFLESSDNICFYDWASMQQHMVPLVWGQIPQFQSFFPVTIAWYPTSK